MGDFPCRKKRRGDRKELVVHWCGLPSCIKRVRELVAGLIRGSRCGRGKRERRRAISGKIYGRDEHWFVTNTLLTARPLSNPSNLPFINPFPLK